MHKLNGLSGKETIKRLEHLGFQQIRQKGSHVVMKKVTSDGEIGCVVPLHKELAVGTLLGILKQARVSVDLFIDAEQ